MRRLHTCAMGALIATTAACTMDVADPAGEPDLYGAQRDTGPTEPGQRRDAGVTKVAYDDAQEPETCASYIREPFQDELYNDDPSVYARLTDYCTGEVVRVNLHFAEYAEESGPIFGEFDLGGRMGAIAGEWKEAEAGRIFMWAEGATDDRRIHLDGVMERHKTQPHEFFGQLSITQ